MSAKVECRSKIFKFTPEEVHCIRKEINLDSQERIDEAIDILEEWVKKQEHFTKKDFRRDYLERTLISSKGSLERAKKQMDRICTFRTLLPKYFEFANVLDDINLAINKMKFAVIPKLTEDFHRIVLIRYKAGVNIESADNTIFYKLLAGVAEYAKISEYCTGYFFIIDISEGNTSGFTSVDFVETQQFLPIFTEGLGCRVKGIVYYTQSKLIEGFVRMLKPLFSEKIRNRIHVCTSVDSLKNIVNLKYLPKEYGGGMKSFDELRDELLEELTAEETIAFIKDMSKACTDESKRHKEKFNEQYMGMPGTFRTLQLD